MAKPSVTKAALSMIGFLVCVTVAFMTVGQLGSSERGVWTLIALMLAGAVLLTLASVDILWLIRRRRDRREDEQ